MAQKRSAENNEDFVVSKILKKMDENENDVKLDSSILSPDFKSYLEYDFVLKTFSVTLEKERKNGNRWICFGEEETENIIKLLPAIEKLVDRYSCKRYPKSIDIPFEVCRADIGEIVTVVSLKENNYKRGHFDVDIRKCVKKEEESYQYTPEGVRFTQSLIAPLKETLLGYQSSITQVTDRSSEVISITSAFAIIREINELADPRQTCQGCQTQHPSQKQHMAEGGCLSTDQPTWEESCNQFWHVGKSLIRDEDVQDLAKRAAAHIPDLQKSFIPGLISTEQVSETEVKDFVERKAEIEDLPLFKMLTEIY